MYVPADQNSFTFLSQVMGADPAMTWAEATETMKKMCTANWDDDKAVVSWVQGSQVCISLSEFVSCIWICTQESFGACMLQKSGNFGEHLSIFVAGTYERKYASHLAISQAVMPVFRCAHG